MTEDNKKIADFILSLFASDGSASQDDVHTAINERYDYDTAPFSVLQTLKDEGLLYNWGEAYYKLTGKTWTRLTSSPHLPSSSMAQEVSLLDGSPRS